MFSLYLDFQMETLGSYQLTKTPQRSVHKNSHLLGINKWKC